MELQYAEVDHRLHQLRRLAATLRLERVHRPAARRWHGLRVAIGRRLVALGTALLEGTGGRVPAPSR
jgi:hypothetical protein